jgi:hypothetical protein
MKYGFVSVKNKTLTEKLNQDPDDSRAESDLQRVNALVAKLQMMMKVNFGY